MKMTIVLALLALLLLGALFSLRLWQGELEFLQGARSVDRSDSAGLGLGRDDPTADGATHRSLGFRRPNVVRFEPPPIINGPSDPDSDISEAETIVEFIESSAMGFDWSPEQVAANYQLWRGACEQAGGMATMTADAAAKLGLTAGFIEGVDAFFGFCGGVVGELDLLSLGQPSDGLATQPGALADLQRLGDDLAERPATDEALRRAVELIDDNLRRRDEHNVISLLGMIAHYELYEGSALDQVEFKFVGYRMVNDVAVTLLCNYSGGCNGADHPMVLRYCFQKFQQGLLCSDPGSIEEAVYQTTTPVNYRWYSLYLGFIQSQLMALS